MNPHPIHPVPVGESGVPGLAPGASWVAAGLRAAFSLVELLVVISIMLVLMAMVGAGVSAARTSQKKQATQALITKIDAVIQQQFASYVSRNVPATVLTGTNKAELRATYLRKLASAEMPDSWEDVKAIANGSAGVARTAPQDAYVGVYQSLKSVNPAWPTSDYGDAECLFMIVMQGGIADCIECRDLKSTEKGDVDGDNAPEFLDVWGNPIRYVLWPAALELPPGTGRFFSSTKPFSSGTAAVLSGTATPPKGGTMRPLIFSAGPDKRGTIAVNAGSNFGPSSPCEDPTEAELGGFDPPDDDPADYRADNITNFDAEAAR